MTLREGVLGSESSVVDKCFGDEEAARADAERLIDTSVVARMIDCGHSGARVGYVHYVVEGNHLYFYAEGRSLLAQTFLDAPIVLEIDDVDPASGLGSSLVIHGTARPAHAVVCKKIERRAPKSAVHATPQCRLVEVVPSSFGWQRIETGAL